MVLVLACAALGGVLLRKFMGLRSSDPDRALDITSNVQNASTMVASVATAVSIILGALWGKAPEVRNGQTRRFGETVGAEG